MSVKYIWGNQRLLENLLCGASRYFIREREKKHTNKERELLVEKCDRWHGEQISALKRRRALRGYVIDPLLFLKFMNDYPILNRLSAFSPKAASSCNKKLIVINCL